MPSELESGVAWFVDAVGIVLALSFFFFIVVADFVVLAYLVLTSKWKDDHDI